MPLQHQKNEGFNRTRTTKDEGPLLANRVSRGPSKAKVKGTLLVTCEEDFKRTSEEMRGTPLCQWEFQEHHASRDEGDTPCEKSIPEHNRQNG